MFQLNKKKIIILLIVWILLLGGTAGVVLYLNKKDINNNKKNKEEEKIVYQNTRDYYSFYDENNLKTETKYIVKDKKNKQAYSYIAISGLKDSQIENKINKELKEFVNDEVDNHATNVYSTVKLNAFNILSVYVSVGYDENDSRLYKAFNYDLTTGNKIMFEDLFANNANISNMVNKGVYNQLSTSISSWILSYERQIEEYGYFIENNPSDKWYGDDIDTLKKKKQEKEEELNNVEDLALIDTRKILNDDEIPFYLTNYGVVIYDRYDWDSITIYAKDYMEYLIFYDRYKSTDSIYKSVAYGKKHLFLSENLNSSYVYSRVEEAGDYGLIDYQKTYVSDTKELDYYNKVINEYKDNFDKNSFTYMNVYSDSSSYKNEKIVNYHGNIAICKMSKEYYKNTYIKKLFDAKKNSDYGMSKYYNNQNETEFHCDTEYVTALLINGHEYKTVESLFVDGFDYEGYLITLYLRQNNILLYEEKTDELKKQFEFRLTGYGSIYIDYLPDNDSNYSYHDVSVEIGDIDADYLKEKI